MKTLGSSYGINIDALDAKPVGPERTPDCPGARIRVTRQDLKAMREGGEFFREEGTYVPAEGYGDARVECSNLVEVGSRGVSGEPVVYGLCSSCHRLEESNRLMLRERQTNRESR